MKMKMLAMALILSSAAVARAEGPMDLASMPALQSALKQMKAELALSDQQSADAGKLIASRVRRVEVAIDSFGGVNFDSVLDLLVEARSIKDEFVPELKGLLNEEQKAKLGKLPKAHEIYIAAMAGWITEGRVKKLDGRVQLTEAQIPQIRSVLLQQARGAVEIVEGLVVKDEKSLDRASILDTVMDLRMMVRQGERGIEPILSAEQKTALEAYRDESSRKERKGDKAAK